MKLIFLITILATILFSNERQIIVGSFLKENNALNDLVRLNNHILSDNKLANLININSIEVELKKIEQYNVISLSPFNNYVQLLRTLKALEPYYNDAYVLENGQKLEITHPVKITEVVVKKLEIPKKVQLQKPKKPEKLKEVEVNIPKQATTVETYEEEKDYSFEIVLALLIFLILGYIIFKTSKRRKTNEEIEESIE